MLDMTPEVQVIDTAGIENAEILAALYNASKPLGMGILHFDPEPMTKEEAAEILRSGHRNFDYLKGRVMKVHLEDNGFDPRLYDRDNGEGAAARVVSSLRAAKR